MGTENSDRDPVEELAEQFLARYRRGENPSPIEYADKYKQWSDAILELFPTLLLMEMVGPQSKPGRLRGTSNDNQDLPKEFGDYRILRVAGRGGMGVVYEAVHRSLERHVALKVLPSSRLENDVRRERFRREAKAAAQLHHSNIVPVFDVGEVDGVLYYAMQFIPGVSLDKIIFRRINNSSSPQAQKSTSRADAETHEPKSGQLDLPNMGDIQTRNLKKDSTAADSRSGENQKKDSSSGLGIDLNPESLADDSSRSYFRSVAKIGIQVAEALDFVHQKGLLHRDIKPSNLLLDDQGRIWITDFGLAKAEGANDLTQAGGIVGTLRYMPPERIRGHSTSQSDVYSLGATLYELLTSRPIFLEQDRVRLMERISNEDPPAVRKIEPRAPIDLETIIVKSLDKDPTRRYNTSGDLAADLNRWLNMEPISARPISSFARLIRWSQRRPAVASLLATVVILTIVGFSMVTWKWRESDRNWQRAEVNLEKSQTVVTEFYTEIARSWGPLHASPGTRQLRRKMLDKAQNYFEEFLLENKDSVNPLHLAFVHFNLGQLQSETGDIASAEKHLRIAERSLEQIVTRTNQPKARMLLGWTYSRLGNLALQSKSSVDSLKLYQQAHDVFEKLVEEKIEPAESASQLADSKTNIGMQLSYDGELSRAAEYFREAIEIRKQLSEDDTNYGARKGLAVSYRALGDLWNQSSQIDQAIESYEKALQVHQQLNNEFPNLDWNQDQFGRCCMKLGEAYQGVGKLDNAINIYQLAIGSMEKAIQRHPELPYYRGTLAKIYTDLGTVYGRIGKRSLARQQYGKALRIMEQLVAENADNLIFRSSLAHANQCLAVNDLKTGFLDKAIQRLKEVLEMRRSLLEENPGLPAYTDDVAKVLTHLGEAYGDKDSIVKATEAFDQAISMRENLCRNYPNVSLYKYRLTKSYLGLGSCLANHEHWRPTHADPAVLDRALDLFQTVEESARQLIKDFPSLLDYQRLLSHSYLNQGLVNQWKGRTKLALEYFQSSFETLEPIAAKMPAASSDAFLLAIRQAQLAVLYVEIGEQDLAIEAREKAIDILNKAVEECEPGNADCLLALNHVMLGSLVSKKDYQRAQQHYQSAESALENVPLDRLHFAALEDMASTYNLLSQRYRTHTSTLDAAIQCAVKGVKVREKILDQLPDHSSQNLLAASHIILGEAYRRANQFEKCEHHFRVAADLHEDLANRHPENLAYQAGPAGSLVNLAQVFRSAGQFEKALKQLESAEIQLQRMIEKSPQHGTARHYLQICHAGQMNSLNGLAWRIATQSDDDAAQQEQAVEYATRACELSRWKNWKFIETLAVAHARTGDFDSAIKFQQQVIELVKNDSTVVSNMQERLELYRQKKPYRQDLK